MRVLLIGCGNISKSYIDVLRAMKVKFDVIGNSDEKSNQFAKENDCSVISGGIFNSFDRLGDSPTHAIIATPINTLSEIALFLIKNGVPNILIEKPGALNLKDLALIESEASRHNSNVFIAYNRRFYQSVEKLNDLIMSKNIKSISFDFTEWLHILSKKNMSKYKSENWFLANSTHLVDLAFYIAGRPKEIVSYVKRGTEWHEKGNVFVGSGLTEKNILFSYHANWNAPGNWKIEIFTDSEKLIFNPLEILKIQKIGEVAVNEVEIKNDFDKKYKPGFYKQVESFLFNIDQNKLLGISDAIQNFIIFQKMLNGNE